MKIYVRDAQFFADGFAVRRAFSLEEGESRALSYVAEGGCGYATISLREGVIITERDCIEVIRRGRDAEVRPLLYPKPPTLRRMSVTKGEESYRIECRAAVRSTIRISGSAVAEWRAQVPLLSPGIRPIDGQKDCIVEISADCPEGRYLLLASLAKGDARILLEAWGESVICRGNEVTVKRVLPDLCEREITTHYLWQGDRFTSSQEISSRQVPVTGENIGRLLLESVIARDTAALRDLLSPEHDAETVTEYFGEICGIEEPLPTDPPTAVTVISEREGEKIAVTYSFDLDSTGRVENIHIVGE